MLKSLSIGIGLLVIALIVSYILKISSFLIITTSISIICILLSAFISGALVSGDRVRAAYTNESSTDRSKRFLWSTNLLLIGLPSILATLLIFMFNK